MLGPVELRNCPSPAGAEPSQGFCPLESSGKATADLMGTAVHPSPSFQKLVVIAVLLRNHCRSTWTASRGQ